MFLRGEGQDSNAHYGWGSMDLSKAFDTINHELLLANLNAYGFDKYSLELMRNYLSSHWQRTNLVCIT